MLVFVLSSFRSPIVLLTALAITAFVKWEELLENREGLLKQDIDFLAAQKLHKARKIELVRLDVYGKKSSYRRADAEIFK